MQPSSNPDDDLSLDGVWFVAERPLASRVLPPLLVAACATADLAVYLWHTPNTPFPSGSGLAYLALAFSQISLATIWASLSRVERLYHWMAAGSAISLLLLGLMRFEPAGEAWFLLIGLHMLALAIPLGMLGAGLSYEPAGLLAADEVLPWQFSLGQAFLLVSGVAILFGLLRAVDFGLRDMMVYCSFGLLFAAIGWISVWSIFSRARGAWRLLVLCLFGPCAGGLLAWLLMGGGDQLVFALFHALLNLAQSLLVSGSLLVLRIAGYRLSAKPVRE